MVPLGSVVPQILSQKRDLNPILHKQTLPEASSTWTAYAFALQDRGLTDAPNLWAPLTVRFCLTALENDILAIVSDLEGRVIKRHAMPKSPLSSSTHNYTIPKPSYNDTLVIHIHTCSIPPKRKDRLSNPDDVSPAPIRSFLLHFFASDQSPPSAALLRKQSTAIDRLLTQNFGISLLHIRLEGDSALAMPSAGPSASGSAALTKRTRDSSSSEPDLFPSVASQSPASAQNGDASVFLNSADGQKAVRRMSNIFVQKLLGQSATKATEQAVQGRWIVPSSPPTMPPTTDDGDEEEEEEQDEEENIEQEEHEQNVDAESFSLAECEERREWVGENPFTWCRCGKCRKGSPSEASGSVSPQEPSTIKSYMDNSVMRRNGEDEYSCSSPHEFEPMKPSQPYPLHQPTAQASAATTAPPPLPTQWPTQDEEVEVDFRSACNFFTARTSFQFDHSHNVSDAQIKLARVSARASMFRRQAQSYPEGSLLREKRLLQADNEESELLEMQYNSLVKSKALQQKRRIEQTAPQPANKRIRI